MRNNEIENELDEIKTWEEKIRWKDLNMKQKNTYKISTIWNDKIFWR